MKHLVVQSSMRSADIRPPEVVRRMQELAAEAAGSFLARLDRLETVACPACDEQVAEPAFERFGFQYVECAACHSLYVARRPTAEALREHYERSRAAEVRIGYFVRDTASARFEYIVQSRVDWISEQLAKRPAGGPLRVADMGTLYPRMFGELRELGLVSRLASIDTDPRIADRLPEGVARDAADAPFDVITAFEQLEHQFSPFEALSRLRALLRPGGTLLLTTRSASGFDISTLWEHAPFLIIPEHLNLLSLRGIKLLLARVGFEPQELSTPGEMDTDIVRQAILDDPSIRVSRFVRALLTDRGEIALDDFQAYLQKHRLSSHVRVTATST